MNTPLCKETIIQQLKIKHFNKPINLQIYDSIDSTNRILKDLPKSTSIEIAAAETQTKGRGRFGRDWHSPYGENIYCSSKWDFIFDPIKFSALSLIVSLAILKTIEEFGIKENISIKWPNDIYWFNKKISGTLIELNKDDDQNIEVIIGIGLNVNSDFTKAQLNMLSDKPWGSLYNISGKYFDRNLLIASLISNLEQYLTKFIDNGAKEFLTQWKEVDYLNGKKITIHKGNETLYGTAMGINEGGLLILLDEKGETHYLSSGDASLHYA